MNNVQSRVIDSFNENLLEGLRKEISEKLSNKTIELIQSPSLRVDKKTLQIILLFKGEGGNIIVGGKTRNYSICHKHLGVGIYKVWLEHNLCKKV